MKRLITLCLLGGCFLSAPAQNYVSQAWVADQGNGTYKNPVLYADYSDPDVCRVGDDYYLTSSSFNCLPGLQNITLQRPCQLDYHRCGCTLRTAPCYRCPS